MGGRAVRDKERKEENMPGKRAIRICQSCHRLRPHHGHGLCSSCYDRIYPRNTRATCHPDKPNHGRGLCQNCYNVKARSTNGSNGSSKKRALLKKIGRTTADLTKLWVAQGERCAICLQAKIHRWARGGKVGTYTFAVDHDHKTGVIRGLICRGCNSLLGTAGDDPALLRRAAEYLERGADGIFGKAG
jgi:hypothetical protein